MHRDVHKEIYNDLMYIKLFIKWYFKAYTSVPVSSEKDLLQRWHHGWIKCTRSGLLLPNAETLRVTESPVSEPGLYRTSYVVRRMLKEYNMIVDCNGISKMM